MQKTYAYLHHQGFDFFLRDRLLTDEELYCPHCQESDTLIGIYETEDALAVKLAELFSLGYDVIAEKREGEPFEIDER